MSTPRKLSLAALQALRHVQEETPGVSHLALGATLVLGRAEHARPGPSRVGQQPPHSGYASELSNTARSSPPPTRSVSRGWRGAAEGREPGEGLPTPNSRFPLLESYIDVVVEGGMEYGPDYAREIIATTADWSAYWLSDRELPRRPWVFDKQYAAVDTMLAATAPHFSDRMFPEEYAAERVNRK